MRLLTVNRRIRRWMGWLALISIASLLVILWQRFTTLQPVVTTPARVEITKTDEPIQPIPQEIVTDRPKVALGEQLFQDVRLSKNSQKSCLSCHSFSLGGADRLAHSIGIDGATTRVNTPTVFNARFDRFLLGDKTALTATEKEGYRLFKNYGCVS